MEEQIDSIDTGNLRQQVITGVSWMILSQVAQQILQFAISIILARLLSPRDFGLLATIMVFTGFASLLGGVGLSNALIQRDKIDDKHLSSAFWVNCITGVFMALVFILLAPAIAAFYNEPLLVNLTRVISLNFILTGLSTTQATILRRSMNFRLLALRDMLGLIVSGACGIIMALSGYGVWSLVIRTLFGSLCTLALLWTATSWRPHLEFHKSAIIGLLGFSSNMLGANILQYYMRNIDNLLIGKFLGSTALGFYARAYSIMLLPLTQVTYVLQVVMFPALSKLQHEPMRVKSIYLRALSFIALITFPIMLGLFVVSDKFILVLYTEKWIDVIPILQILCLVGMAQSLTSTTRWIYASQGRSDWMLKWGLFSTTITILSFVPGILLRSVEILALGYAVANLLLLFWEFYIPGRLINLSFGDVVKSVDRITICSITMAMAVYGLNLIILNSWSKMFSLIIDCFAGAIIYFILINMLNLTAYQEARNIMSNLIEIILAKLMLRSHKPNLV